MKDPNARINWAHKGHYHPLDPIDILNALADSCSRMEDRAFWILTSAAAHLNGYNLEDGEGSSVARWWLK